MTSIGMSARAEHRAFRKIYRRIELKQFNFSPSEAYMVRKAIAHAIVTFFTKLKEIP